MNENQFKAIYRSIHLMDEEAAHEAGIGNPSCQKFDSNYKITSYLNKILEASQSIYKPRQQLSIDEMMAKFTVSLTTSL